MYLLACFSKCQERDACFRDLLFNSLELLSFYLKISRMESISGKDRELHGAGNVGGFIRSGPTVWENGPLAVGAQ